MRGRKPQALILENVCGLASSHDGNDFRAVVQSFNDLGYSVDAFELNARRWLPQPRPRMFVVGLQNPIDGGILDVSVRPDRLSWIRSDEALVTHVTPPLLSFPSLMTTGFTKFAEKLDDDDFRWWDKERVSTFVASLSPLQKRRMQEFKEPKGVVARTAYRPNKQ